MNKRGQYLMKEAIDSRCALCESLNANLLYKEPSWDVYRCSNCQLVRVQTKALSSYQVEEEGSRHEALGGDYMQKVFIDQHDFWLNYWSYQIDRIKPMLATTSPRLLDIGCAMGHFMLAAREAGWQVVGVELSEKQAEYARNILNLDVISLPIEEADFTPHSFDIVTLWSVIEHVHDPKAIMLKVNRLLKPGGIVVVKTPNQESLITLLAHYGYIFSAGRYLLPVYSDDHLYRFSEKTVVSLSSVADTR